MSCPPYTRFKKLPSTKLPYRELADFYDESLPLLQKPVEVTRLNNLSILVANHLNLDSEIAMTIKAYVYLMYFIDFNETTMIPVLLAYIRDLMDMNEPSILDRHILNSSLVGKPLLYGQTIARLALNRHIVSHDSMPLF